MIDITREEIWDNKAQEIEKKNNNSRVNSFIKRHKIITVSVISLGMLMTVNIVLIYNFFKILISI